MKICLISFDYWDYDYHIIEALKRKGIDAKHIDISDFTYVYKTPFHRIQNFLSKLFLKKNIKKVKSQEYVIDKLKNYGKQNYILSIRPDSLDIKTHQTIKTLTDNYIAYIYDSCTRFPIDHLLDGIFDKIYSFDLNDVKKYNFKHITNYIYHEKRHIKTDFKYDVFIVLSVDERLNTLNEIASFLDNIHVVYKFIVVGKRKPKNLHPKIIFTTEEIRPETLKELVDNTRIMLDLIRLGHNGLSFRIFESLAYQKKLITTNNSIQEYDFYNSNNIAIIENDIINIDAGFFKTPYKILDRDTYQKYTVDNWVDEVFDLK